MLGYALLASTYWYGFGFKPKRVWQAWLFAVIYALSDEFHQSFTPGRNSSYIDVFVFDGGGAALGLGILAVRHMVFTKRKPKNPN